MSAFTVDGIAIPLDVLAKGSAAVTDYLAAEKAKSGAAPGTGSASASTAPSRVSGTLKKPSAPPAAAGPSPASSAEATGATPPEN